MFNGVGGSTILFSGHWVRAMPSDFRVKTLDGVAEDWPFTYEDLRPFYDSRHLCQRYRLAVADLDDDLFQILDRLHPSQRTNQQC